jgi:hypothetical protein
VLVENSNDWEVVTSFLEVVYGARFVAACSKYVQHRSNNGRQSMNVLWNTILGIRRALGDTTHPLKVMVIQDRDYQPKECITHERQLLQAFLNRYNVQGATRV